MTFTARYPGRCASCDAPIQPGDEVQYGVDNQLVHADCQEIEEARSRPGPICPTCWLTQPCEHTEEA